MKSLSSFAATLIDGTPVQLSKYANNVTLIVNTASKCGFIPSCINYDPRAHVRRPIVMMRHG